MTDGRGHYEELSDRARHLLRVLVDRYVREGHPVGSRTLSKESGLELSPATIRNVMSDLEDLGYIGSPHTSAGRIPTAKGYRFFVDTMVNLQSLSEVEIRELQERLERKAGSGRQLVETASNLLSGLTHMAGVVTVPRQVVGSLRQIEFLPLSDRRVLAILVVNDTQVRNRILNVDRNYTADELKRVSNYLTEQFAGKTIASVRDTIVGEMQRTRESMDRLMADAIGIARRIFAEDSGNEGGYYLAGETNLMDFDELSDVDKLRELFEAFGRKRDILHLLDRAMISADLQIFIGGESGYQILDECSVVVSPYTVDQEIVGVLGVIGPTRMAYERVIPIVDVTARLLGSALKSAD
ncbi:MAG: heat-inducible transcriptional repressor HrcA [Gammaproteobacteria bacterium]|nr:MAG: heat-inducible transcriptional repressor HrcA [Gammaproteobacteria bacterium]